MRKNIIFLLIVFTCFSCSVSRNKKQIEDKPKMYEYINNCRVITKENLTEINGTKALIEQAGFQNNDTVLSIGSETGGREFLISLFTDNILFYLEDIDTFKISQSRIQNVYLPYYSEMKGSPISNKFITVKGTQTYVGIPDNSVNKILIYNAYHHFKDDIAMVKECKRVLRDDGKLIIGEHVTKRNKRSRAFCTAGGRYKTEENFVNDIVNIGFVCDTVYNSGNEWRLFVFSE